MTPERGEVRYLDPRYSLQLYPTLYLPSQWERNIEIASDTALVVGTGFVGAYWILLMAGALK